MGLLARVDFSGGPGTCTYLEGASFQNANLTSADLYCFDCMVTGRRGLKNVNLAEADLTDAIAKKSSFAGVNLCGAILPNGRESQQGC